MSISFFENSSVVGADGLFFPISDLPGIVASELATLEASNKKHSKFLFSFLDKLATGYNTNHLGFSIIKGKPTISNNSVNLTYNISTQVVVNLINNNVIPIPVPSSGDNLGIGDFGLADYFPGVSVVTSTDTAGPGVLIPFTDLTNYGVSGTPTLGTDDRALLFSLVSYITESSGFAVRSTSPAVQSAIITKQLASNVLTELPTISYAATNPTTGLSSSNKSRQLVLQRNYTYIIQLSLSALSTEINYA